MLTLVKENQIVMHNKHGHYKGLDKPAKETGRACMDHKITAAATAKSFHRKIFRN